MIHRPFLLLSVIVFVGFSIYAHVVQFVVSSNKLDIFADSLSDIAVYFLPFDSQVSEKILSVDRMVTAYRQGENILQTQSWELRELFGYIRQRRDYLTTIGFGVYQPLLDLISESVVYQDEIFDLLWASWPKHYLIILQNSAEKRPNGWFFGSFAFATISGGFIQDVEIIDTYFPNTIAPDTYVDAPSWAHDFMAAKIWFLSSNRFWFTLMDGLTIKTLFDRIFGGEFDPVKAKAFFAPDVYEQLFYQQINGVVFIRSDLLTQLIPGFEYTLRERQFANASIDIIRWVNKSNKKELYIKQVNEYFDKNKGQIFKFLVQQLSDIQDRRYIQMYLPAISNEFLWFLVDQQFVTRFDPRTIYSRDNNISFNKSDLFVTKTISITDQQWSLLWEHNQDINTIPQSLIDMYRGKPLVMTIQYSLNAPDRYLQFINQLQTQYGIQLTQRERSILVLEPTTWIPDTPPVWRKTQGNIYYPLDWMLRPQGVEMTQFQSPFAKGRVYESMITQNNETVTISFDLIMQ